MPIANHDLCELTSSIWASFLGLNIRPTPRMDAAWGRELLTGCIHISGTWEGVLTLECPVGLARHVAGIMFSEDSCAATPNEILDALGEVTNVTAGNIKALFGGACHLSMPAVAEGPDHRLTIPRGRVVIRQDFDCEGQSLTVTLYEKDEKPGCLH